MRISFRHFRTFVAAAETGQISRAATALFTSQSVVTETIKALEEHIGVSLFHRHAKGVSLTAEGEVFLRHAREVLSAAFEAVQAPRLARHDIEGVLRLASSHTVSGYFLPILLARFKRQYPGITVHLVELAREDIECRLLSGEVEIAVCLTASILRRDLLDCEILKQSKRRLWLPAGHHLISTDHVTLRDLEHEPYILLSTDDSKQTTYEYWRRAGLTPNVVFQTESIEAARNLVACGMGITILSDLIYRPWTLDNTRLEAVSLADDIPTMDVGLVWKYGTDLSVTARTFLSACRFSRTTIDVELY